MKYTRLEIENYIAYGTAKSSKASDVREENSRIVEINTLRR